MSTSGDSADVRVIMSQATRESRIMFSEDWAESWGNRDRSVFLVVDSQLDKWIAAIKTVIEPQSTLQLDIEESKKNLDTLSVVYEWLAHMGATRDTVIVAMGGGVLTDLVGYAAATYLRGLTWIAIPTTLLAQVDAAIGGKVAVNTTYGKNLLGAFHLPSTVIIDPKFLTTLPPEEWRAGLGEILKSSVIEGGTLYDAIMGLALHEGSVVDATWRSVIRQTAEIKIDLVNQDLFEQGPRMYLNFGHTVGHALENLLGYGTLTHGEAVGIGSLVALALSELKLGLSPTVRQSLKGIMTGWQMPTAVPPVSFDRLWDQLYRDKKARRSGLTWVLLETLGKPQLNRTVTPDEVRMALKIVSAE